MDDTTAFISIALDFEVYDYDELRATASFREFSYHVDPIGRQVVITGPRHRNINTIFGGDTGQDILIPEEEVSKLPHNMVHSSLHGTPEGETVLSGFTPDICIPVGQGQYDVLEITTVESGRIRDVADAMNLKVEKYGGLTRGPRPLIRALNLLVVTPDGAYDLNGKIQDTTFSRTVISAYVFGLRIARLYSDNPGFRLGNKFSHEETKGLKEEFNAIEWGKKGPITDQYMQRVIPPHPTEWILSLNTIEEKYGGFDEYEDRMRNKREQRDPGQGTIVHVPMVLVERRELHWSDAEMSELDNVYAKFFNQCLASGLHDHQQHDFETLLHLSELDSNPKPKRQPSEGPDMIFMTLDEEDKIDLAERGLLAKKHRLDYHDHIKEKRIVDKLDINYDEDLYNIPEYLMKDIQMLDECVSFREIEHCFDDKVFLDHRKMIESASAAAEIHSLKFLDAIMKEISYNLVRSPRDSRRGRQFIYRMIPGYHAFIVIRTTSPASMDQAHIFYSVFFRGRALEMDVFEEVYELDNDWKYTKFLSIDQLRLSQYQNVHLRAIFHWFSMLDEAGDPQTGEGDGISHETNINDLLRFSEPWKVLLLILLEDKQVTSSTLQDFRYYYMELNTSFRSSISRSEKLASRLPDMIRSRLLLYFIRRIIEIHRSLTNEVVLAATTIPDVIDSDPDEMHVEEDAEIREGIDLEQAHFRITKGIDTPFHFKINNPGDLVRAMYMGYLHNKDEGFKGHGVVKMLEKTLKMAYKWKDMNISDPASYCAQNHVNPDGMHLYQHSAPAVKMGCDLLKRRLTKRAGIPLASYDDYISDKILKFSLKSSLSELSTTKASTIPFDDVLITTTEGEEIKAIGRKRKCIEAVLASWDDYVHVRTAMNVGSVLNNFRVLEDGRIRVTLFKKNQIGGTREIYILTMRGRILTKIFSDIFRSICELHPSEILTKPENKATFVADHYSSKREIPGKYKATYKVSMDKSTWAQMFNLYSFADMCIHLLPPFLLPFCQNVLNAHKMKMLQLPRSLIQQFLDNPESTLSSDNVQRLKEEFLGIEPHLLLGARNSSSFENSVDMMQGILHYPSSCYHLAQCEYQSAMAGEWLRSRGVSSHYDFLVGSDDEAGLISIGSDDKDHLIKVMGQFHNAFGRIAHSSDKLFGTETSDKKTSRTYADVLEVNSEFYFGNTCQRALSKFENNALFDDPGESLHLRISALYAKLRELRSAGASGALCSLASALQALCFTANLGVGAMGWYYPGLYESMTSSLTTVSGYYFIFNELKAGLMDSSYVNWLSVMKRGSSSAKIVYYLNNYALPLTPSEYISAKFSMFPKQKYFDMLKRLGLSTKSQSELMTEDLFRSLLVGSQSLDEERSAIEYQVLTPSISRSMAFLNRTHVDRMAPYILWSAMYRDPDSLRKYSLRTLLRRAETMNPDPSAIDPKILFPMSEQYSKIRELSRLRYAVGGSRSYRRLYVCQISPQYYTEESVKYMQPVLSYIWFNHRTRLSRRQCEDYFSELQSKIPWLRRSLSETMEVAPVRDLHELYGFVSSSRSIVSSFSALVRGRPRRSFSSVQALIKNNVFSRRAVVSIDSPLDAEDAPGLSAVSDIFMAQKVGDRLRAWKDLLQEARDNDSYVSQKLRESFLEDCKWMSSLVPKIMKEQVTSSSDEDRIAKHIALLAGELRTDTFMRNVSEAVIYLSVQQRSGRSFSGGYRYIHKKDRVTADITLLGSTISVVSNCSREHFTRVFKITPDSHQYGNVGVPSAVASKVEWIKNNLLITFISEHSSAEYYMDLPRTHIRQFHLRRESGPHTRLLESWLSRVEVTSDEVHDMLASGVRGADEFGIVVRSLLRICKRNEPKMNKTRLAERMEHASEPVAELEGDLSELIEMLADALEPTEEITLAEQMDAFDAFVTHADDVWTKRLASMEATALESFVSLMDSNRCLFSLLKVIKSYKNVPKRSLREEVADAVYWYETLKI